LFLGGPISIEKRSSMRENRENNLTLYATGQLRARGDERSVAARGKRVYDDVRLSALKADGAFALGAHIMEGITDLDSHRRALAGGNQQLDAVLSAIELDTIRQVQGIQRGLYSPFGI
jgi:hypothetical protein